MSTVNAAEVARLAQIAATDRQTLIRQRDAMAGHDRLTFNLTQTIHACERTIIQLAALLIRPAFAS
jgi:hypothetical protein